MRDAPKKLLEDIAQAHVMPLLNPFWDGLRYTANWLEIAQRSLVAAWVVSETSHFLNQYSMGLNFTLLEATATIVLSALSTHAAFGIPAMTALLVALFTIIFGQLKGGTITMVTPVCERPSALAPAPF